MSDVKEEEVVNRITKMAAELHFSGDWSSISGMKVPGYRNNELVMESMVDNTEKSLLGLCVKEEVQWVQ